MTPDREKPGIERLHAGRGPGAGEDAHERADVPGFPTLPKELGVILLSAGVLGLVIPGPGTPAIIAGGLVLWPKGFGRAEVWFRRRFPSVHRGGMRHVRRFLEDLEHRYPGSLG